MLSGDGFLGTSATLASDITLILQIIFFVAVCVGAVVQRFKKYRLHDWIQTPVVILNLILVVVVMIASFRRQQVIQTLPQRPTDLYYVTAFLHAGLGLVTALLSVYLLLAGHKILPRRIGQLRYFMWAGLVFWTLTFLCGVTTYLTWYVFSAPATEAAVVEESAELVSASGEAGPQRVLMQNFNFLPAELTIVAGTEVVWLNQDGAPHNVTFVNGDVVSENFFQGFTFSHIFDDPGVFEMYCSLHGGPGSGMHSTITVLENTEENLAQAEAAQAAQPTPNPVPPTPTPAPPVPPPPVALIEPPAPEESVVGIASFHDVLGHSDQLQVSLTGLAAPAPNRQYEAWLVDHAGGGRLNLGIIAPAADGSLNLVYNEPQKLNLLALYDGFEITDEPQFDDDPSAGPVIYGGQQPPEATAFIRQITIAAPDTPGGIAYALGGRAQTEELQRHVAELASSYEFLSIADAKRHAEHIVNILEGELGAFFGDLDGVHGAQNPGDGFGVIPYLQMMYSAADQAALASDATSAVETHAQHVRLAAGNSMIWAEELREAALGVLDAQGVGDIGPQVETLSRVSTLLLNGEDRNGDGNVAPDEGGIFTAYQHAQYMAAIGVSTNVVGAIQAAPTSTPAPEQAGLVTVLMLDFRFDAPSLTIPAGTTVRFVNQGQMQHSATADDGSFDTGLLSAGGEATITFDTPGTYPYYCLLHGAAGGLGMAGVIIVE